MYFILLSSIILGEFTWFSVSITFFCNYTCTCTCKSFSIFSIKCVVVVVVVVVFKALLPLTILTLLNPQLSLHVVNVLKSPGKSACAPISWYVWHVSLYTHIVFTISNMCILGHKFSAVLNYVLFCIRFYSSLCQNQQNKDITGGCHSGFQRKWLSASWTTKHCFICHKGKHFNWYDCLHLKQGSLRSLLTEHPRSDWGQESCG